MGVKKTEFTYREFVDYSQSRILYDGNHESSRSSDEEFTQTKSFEEAIDFATNGWDLGLEQYKIEDGVLVGGNTHLTPSLAGCIPHVQNHIMGFPQQMYDLYDEREYNLPTLNLVVPLAYAGRVKGLDALTFSKSLIKYINKMASSRNIKITGVFASQQNDNVESLETISLKNFDEALVINNIAFAFHPSFFRRCWFSLIESKSYLAWGYGSSITGNDYKKLLKENLDTESSDETIYFQNLQNVYTFDWDESDLDNITLKDMS